MSVNLGMNTKILIIFVLLISGGLWFYSAFAQDIGNNTSIEEKKLEVKLNEFDNLLSISIATPLTALSLTGAAFLNRGDKNDDPVYTQLILSAKKHLIKAFVFFLACTLSIFIFSFIRLMFNESHIILEITNILITYSLFFLGFVYLGIAAKEMFITQAK
ncbi:MAG: hypothetical protein P4K92_00570 [Candidatus Nitrosotalea sp.]|nr:hypothetical protein [Candidatus Nitrosotalea sp.]